MQNEFEINRTKIKGGCQLETKAVHCYSCIDLTLVPNNLASATTGLGGTYWYLLKTMKCFLNSVEVTVCICSSVT